MRAECRKTLPYVDIFRALGWIDESGETTSVAPPLPKQKRERKKGGLYAELTDSSSSSSSSSSDDSSSSEAEGPSPAEPVSSAAPKDGKEATPTLSGPAGPKKFLKVVEKLRVKTKDPDAVAKIAEGPRCPHCKEGLLKPDAVYFGEPLYKPDIKRALALSSAAKAFLIVGTSGQVAPACKLPVLSKVKASGKVIEISPRETELSAHAEILLLGSAATVLPALADAVEELLAERRPENMQGKRKSLSPVPG